MLRNRLGTTIKVKLSTEIFEKALQVGYIVQELVTNLVTSSQSNEDITGKLWQNL